MFRDRGPKYKKLNQYEGVDSSEEEDVIFEGDHSVGHARLSLHRQQRGLGGLGQDGFMFSSYDVDADLRLPADSTGRGKMRVPLPAWCTYRRCLLAVVVSAVIAVALAAVIFWFFLQSPRPAAALSPTEATGISNEPAQTSSRMRPTPSESLASPVPGESPPSTSPVPSPSPTSTSPVLSHSPGPTSPVPGESPTSTSPVLSHSPGPTSPVPGESPTSTSPVLSHSPGPTSPVPGESPTSASPVPGHSPGPTVTPAPVEPPSDIPAHSTINYTREFPQSLTEMTPEFYDLNGDSVLDILLSLGSSQSMAFDFWKCHGSEKEEARKACMTYFGFYPCGSIVVALDGRTGQELWRYNAIMEVFAVTCPNDLTGDGAVDCMLCGRAGMWEAIDGRTGEHIWSLDYLAVNPLQNLYFPLAVGDLDKDGTEDFVNMNSGDPRYDPKDHNRPPGRLLVVSGKTGQQLLEPLLVPDMKESYMSPAAFSDDNGHKFILIGTGGETVEGGLWAITMESLEKKVKMYLQETRYHTYFNDPANDSRCHKDAIAFIDSTVPTSQPEQYAIKNLSKDVIDAFFLACPETMFHPVPNDRDLCVYRVIASPEKGVILPPVIIDMNDDQVDDIVISLYSGHTLVMDGKTGSIIWDRYIPGTESYSIPAPLFYNSDQIPDLFVRVNKGTWDKGYTFSYVAVVDGTDGSLLWAHNSSGVGFMSATTLRGTGFGNDALLFISVGNLQTLPLDKVKTLERVTKGGLTTHEWSSSSKERKRRRVETVAESSLSITEELDTRLGLIKKRSNNNGDDEEDIASLEKLLNASGLNEEVVINESTNESTNSEGGSESPGVEPSGDTSALNVTTDTDFSIPKSSSMSIPLSSSPPVAAQMSSTTTLPAYDASATSSLPAPTSAERHATSSSAESSSVALSSSEALTAALHSHSGEIGASVLPSVSSGGSIQDSQTSSTVGVAVLSQPIDVSQSQGVARPSNSTITLQSSHVEVLSSSAVEVPLTSEAASSSQLVAARASSTSLQTKSSLLLVDSLLSSASQTTGDSPQSSTIVMSSTSPDTAVAVKPTSHTSPVSVDIIHSTSLVSSSSAHQSTSQHPQTSPSPPPDQSGYRAFFDSHFSELQQSLNYLFRLQDRSWLDFTKGWEEVYNHNPMSETQQFIANDCRMQSHSDSHVYFLTRAMIEGGHIHPLYEEVTRMSYPNFTALENELNNYHHERPRRHEGPEHPSNTVELNDHDLRHDWGCLHIIRPGIIASTPSFADLDGDGRVELVYFVPYGSHFVQAFPGIPFRIQDAGTDMMFMRVVTLEDAFQEKIAPRLQGKISVDFSTFLQYDRQPWTKYMGSSGDSHYQHSYQGL